VTRWNGKTDGGNPAASGVYFYRITFPDGSISSKKMMILTRIMAALTDALNRLNHTMEADGGD
jgi:hypothetical protein